VNHAIRLWEGRTADPSVPLRFTRDDESSVGFEAEVLRADKGSQGPQG
jgi:hypothetical protein